MRVREFLPLGKYGWIFYAGVGVLAVGGVLYDNLVRQKAIDSAVRERGKTVILREYDKNNNGEIDFVFESERLRRDKEGRLGIFSE